jgi:hypothetical protein
MKYVECPTGNKNKTSIDHYAGDLLLAVYTVLFWDKFLN